jgi:predicted  nucleic acid-binding Zn-ribbon protein
MKIMAEILNSQRKLLIQQHTQNKKMNMVRKRIVTFEHKWDKKFNNFEEKIDSLEKQIDGLEKKVDGHEEIINLLWKFNGLSMSNSNNTKLIE